jgi:polyisoprenyl-phosphate glycosyltransferase
VSAITPATKPLISVVVPCYNERDNIDELGRRLGLVFDAEDRYDFEAILVENGSADDTWEKANALHDRDPRFKVLQLARNFRMDGGLTAGLNHATGDAAVVMAGDLQDPPEVIPDFLRRWEEGYDIVYQIVTARRGTGPVRRFNSWLFYQVANRLTDGRIPRNVSDFRLVDRKVYETVNQMEERNRFVRGLFAWVGFKSIGVEAERQPRTAGVSGAHTFKVIDLAMKGIFAHSYLPLKFISIFGALLSMLSFLAIVVLAVCFVAFGVPFAGFGTIVCLVVLMFGFLFTMLGVVAEYVGLIYEEVKQRPNFVVRERVGLEGPKGADETVHAVHRGEERQLDRT